MQEVRDASKKMTIKVSCYLNSRAHEIHMEHHRTRLLSWALQNIPPSYTCGEALGHDDGTSQQKVPKHTFSQSTFFFF